MNSRNYTGPLGRRRIAILTTVAFTIALFVIPQAMSAEWRFEPLIRAGSDFDDNSILTTRTDLDSEVTGLVVDARTKIAYGSATTEFFVVPRISSRNYDNSDFDADDLFLNFVLDHDTRSSNFRFFGNYDLESVRTAERADTDLDVEDPDLIPDDDSGRVFLKGDRVKLQLVPRWTYRPSSVSSISWDLDYTNVGYDDVFVDQLAEYTNARTNLTYKKSWSPRNAVIFSGSYRLFSPAGREEVNSVGLAAGIERTLSETTRLRAIVGLENTDQQSNSNDVNWVANLSLTRRLQTITMLVQYRRTISASGAGLLSSRDSMNINFTRSLSERISAGLGVRAYQTNALNEGAVIFDERNYVQLRAQFTWKLTPAFSVEANYRYSILNRSLLGESANSNNVTLWLNYRPRPITRSR